MRDFLAGRAVSLLDGLFLLFVISVGGLIVGYVRAKGLRVLDPIMYGIAFMMLFGYGLYLVRATSQLSMLVAQLTDLTRSQAENAITPDNAEAMVRKWSDGFSYGVRRIAIPGARFALEVTMSGEQVAVAQRADQPRYLELTKGIVLHPVHAAMVRGFSDQRLLSFQRGLVIELARAGVEWGFRPEVIVVMRHVPLTAQLNDHEFAQAVVNVSNVGVMLRELIAERLGPVPSSNVPNTP